MFDRHPPWQITLHNERLNARLLEIIVCAVHFVLPQACKGIETLAATVALIGASRFLR
jgi:hypothetical protein